MESKIASFVSPTEQPVVNTINVTAHNPTKIISTIFQTDFQYPYLMIYVKYVCVTLDDLITLLCLKLVIL